MFLSITSVEDNRPVKYLEFASEADALVHAGEYGGFVAVNPGGDRRFWVVDLVTKIITEDSAASQISYDASEYVEATNTRREAYGPISDELDMIYWDQVNGTTTFKDHVAAIKTTYPKP